MTDITTVKQRFGIIGASELLDRALEVAVRVAPSDLTVLVTAKAAWAKSFSRRSSTLTRPANTINI